MREIKFRAWDKKTQSIRFVVKAIFAFGDASPLAVIVYDFGKPPKIDYKELLCKQECELMQYTGLKDKNGKEIWEGDIVKVEEGNFEVCFLEGCWYLRRKFDGGLSFGRLNETWTEAAKKKLSFEVIGNIYENPELLEGK